MDFHDFAVLHWTFRTILKIDLACFWNVSLIIQKFASIFNERNFDLTQVHLCFNIFENDCFSHFDNRIRHFFLENLKVAVHLKGKLEVLHTFCFQFTYFFASFKGVNLMYDLTLLSNVYCAQFECFYAIKFGDMYKARTSSFKGVLQVESIRLRLWMKELNCILVFWGEESWKKRRTFTRMHFFSFLVLSMQKQNQSQCLLFSIELYK